MAFKTSYNAGLGQPAFNVNAVDVTPKVAIGTTLKGFDDVQGEGSFIYLPGAANVAAGDVVTFDLLPTAPGVTRAAVASANAGTGIAVAVVDVPAGSYGWFQVTGVAIANAIAATAVGRSFISATAGSLTSVAAAGLQILGSRISSAVGTPAAGKVYVTLIAPHVQGQIT